MRVHSGNRAVADLGLRSASKPTPPQGTPPPTETPRDRLETAWHVGEGLADGINSAAGMAALGTGGLMLGGFLSGSILSIMGVTSAGASIPALVATGSTVLALTVGGGLLGGKLGSALSHGAGRLATFTAEKVGLARPGVAGALAKGALATAALSTAVMGPLVLRSAAVAAGVLLLGEGVKAGYRGLKSALTD